MMAGEDGRSEPERRPPVSETSLEGTVLVTGGGGGIGAEICRAARSWGAERVLVCDVDSESARRVAGSIEGGEAIGVDVSDRDSIDSLVARLETNGWRLSAIVNAAALLGGLPFPQDDAAEWRRVLGVNLVGCYSLVVAARHLLDVGGSIVNISSVEGLYVLSTGGRTQTPYAVSKGGLEMLTKTLAVDLAPLGVRVNAVAPGFIQTDMNRTVFENEARSVYIQRRIPLQGRVGEPADIAGIVCFLMSTAARYITGHTVVADGGMGLGVIRYEDDGGSSAEGPVRSDG